MKFLKNNLKVIIAFIIGLILAGGIVYAATSANQVIYTTTKNAEIQNVEDALNDLYDLTNFDHFSDEFLNETVFGSYDSKDLRAWAGSTKENGMISLNSKNALYSANDISIPQGHYFILINGQNLDNNLIFDITDADNPTYIKRPNKVNQYEHYAYYYIDITQNLSKGAIRIWNNSETEKTKVKYTIAFKID